MTSPMPTGLGTATLTEWNLAAAGSGQPVQGGVSLTVDFDPKSLQLKYAVSLQSPGQQTQTSGVQRNKAPAQWTSETTTLTLQLIFDSTTTGQSVQLKTNELVQLTQPSAATAGSKAPRGESGAVQVGGVLLLRVGDLARPDHRLFCPRRPAAGHRRSDVPGNGAPRTATRRHRWHDRAGQQLRQRSGGGRQSRRLVRPRPVGAPAISAAAGISASASAGVSAAVGTTPLTLSAAGDTVQSITALGGAGASWKVVAAANNIDNPRILPPGTVLDLSATATASVSAGIQTS